MSEDGPLDHLDGRPLHWQFLFALACLLSLLAQLVFGWNWVVALVAVVDANV